MTTTVTYADRPPFDTSFDAKLLHDYLLHLIRTMHGLDEDSPVNPREFLDVLLDENWRLKEPLFLLSILDGKYEEVLGELLSREQDDKVSLLVDEWEELFSKLDNRPLAYDLMKEMLPRRYARLADAAKVWRYRTTLRQWERDNKLSDNE